MAVLIWVFVDDFLLHGPTKEKTKEALTFFLDTVLKCRLLCHPIAKKIVKYCGVLLDNKRLSYIRLPITQQG